VINDSVSNPSIDNKDFTFVSTAIDSRVNREPSKRKIVWNGVRVAPSIITLPFYGMRFGIFGYKPMFPRDAKVNVEEM